MLYNADLDGRNSFFSRWISESELEWYFLQRTIQFGVDASSVILILLILWWIYSGALKKDRCETWHRVEPRSYVAARRSQNKRVFIHFTSSHHIDNKDSFSFQILNWFVRKIRLNSVCELA